MPDNDGTPTPAPQPTTKPTTTMTAAKAWSWAKDILVVLVIPLFLWGVKLEVGNAKRDKELEYQAEKIQQLQEDLKEAQDIEDGVQDNALKLVQLEGKLDTANGRLNDIKELLRDR
jgi:hypothetical protein